LPARTVVVKYHGVKIGLASVIGPEHDPDRGMVFGQPEPDSFECLTNQRKSHQLDDQVDVFMGTRLLAEKGIHPPATIEPDPQASPL
jgi:hypothetical protein